MLRMTGAVNSGWKSLTWLQVKEGFKQLVKKLDLKFNISSKKHSMSTFQFQFYYVTILLC